MKKLLALLTLLVLAAAAWMMTAGRSAPDWSSTSPAALAAFEAGMEAMMKYYGAQAQRHFREAVELDPNFVAPKLLLLQLTDREERERLIGELRAAELDTLTGRERFLVRYALALTDQRKEEAERILDGYLEHSPEDPYALSARSNLYWEAQDWSRAQATYERLLESAPNWVTAQNRLGYIAMAQGRFADAEEQFRTYVYVAPDQPNPHDSLGELLTLVGRYQEAVSELEKALAIKPDFCITYQHLIAIWVLEGLPEAVADGVVERCAEHCGSRYTERLRCEVVLWRAVAAGDWDAPWTEAGEGCLDAVDPDHHLLHRLAVLSGRSALALEIEARVRQRAATDTLSPATRKLLAGVSSHLEGARALVAGDAGAAAERLAAADGQLLYWGDGQGTLKLYNRLSLAYALERAGRLDESRQLRDDVAAINAAFAGLYDAVRRMYGAPEED